LNNHLYTISQNLATINNMSGVNSGTSVTIDGATLTTVDSLDITLVLTEIQRVRSLEISGTPGGDGTTAVVDILSNFGTDISFNPSTESLGIVLTETPDSIIPRVLNASLNYSTGNLLIFISETADSTPSSRVNLSQIFISNQSYVPLDSRQRNIVGSFINQDDKMYLNITLNERLRYYAIKSSGKNGGDGYPNLLHVLMGTFNDIGLNYNNDTLNLKIEEFEDIVRPQFTSVTLNFSYGYLVTRFSETIRVFPDTFTPSVLYDLSNVYGKTRIVSENLVTRYP
jgi:hypothetical protein